jgi:hypothetical protein
MNTAPGMPEFVEYTGEPHVPQKARTTTFPLSAGRRYVAGLPVSWNAASGTARCEQYAVPLDRRQSRQQQ